MNLDKEELQEILETVTTVLSSTDEYLALGESVVEAAKPALTKALKILLKVGVDVRKGMEDELAELSKIKATSLHRDYKNYTAAGFGKKEAFSLVLASIKPVNFSEMLGQASKAASSRKSS